jgi:hypothetical protein
MTGLDTRTTEIASTFSPVLMAFVTRVARLEGPGWGEQDGATDDSALEATDFQDPSEISFATALSQYLSSTGLVQRRVRSAMASRLLQSRRPRKRIRQVLEAIHENPSEDRLEAAVDLLSLAGKQIEEVARELAFSSENLGDDVAYVVAAAAGRANTSLVGEVLVFSGREAMREAAAELATGLPPEDARQLLRSLASNDRAPYIRKLATALLDEID